ncbi:hypothetical protein HDU67_007790 [Dinochytrium kinnereticum]|nr:hypothetical protein HDU67_007790 [Dinochytrium kinnereticum]
MTQNQLSGPIPDLSRLTRLTQLFLWTNEFSGNVPTGFPPQLEILDLYGNNLSGPIPKELGALQNLSFLSLSRNSLTGSLPRELGNMTALRTLRVFNNQLSGTIPAEIGQLSNLADFDLFTNKFTGEIPTSISNLSFLTFINFGHNRLYGRVPDQLKSLTRLNYFYIGDNFFTGPVPEFFVQIAAAGSCEGGGLCAEIDGNCFQPDDIKGISNPYVFRKTRENEKLTSVLNPVTLSITQKGADACAPYLRYSTATTAGTAGTSNPTSTDRGIGANPSTSSSSVAASSSSGLSPTTTLALGVGIPLLVLAVVGAVIAWVLVRKRRNREAAGAGGVKEQGGGGLGGGNTASPGEFMMSGVPGGAARGVAQEGKVIGAQAIGPVAMGGSSATVVGDQIMAYPSTPSHDVSGQAKVPIPFVTPTPGAAAALNTYDPDDTKHLKQSSTLFARIPSPSPTSAPEVVSGVAAGSAGAASGLVQVFGEKGGSGEKSGYSQEGGVVDRLGKIAGWGVEEVCEWLKGVGLGEAVVEGLRAHNVNGYRLLLVSDQMLLEMGIRQPSVRSFIIMAVQELRGDVPAAVAPIGVGASVSGVGGVSDGDAPPQYSMPM